MATELSDGVKRHEVGAGECSWCGARRRRLYVYSFPGLLDYRLGARAGAPAFCNKGCAISYRG